jgi:hypothetical protein
LLRVHLLGVHVAEVDAQFWRLRLGATLGGASVFGVSELLVDGVSCRAGFTIWERPRRWWRFGDEFTAPESRAGFYSMQPELYLQVEHHPDIGDLSGDEYYSHSSVGTLNIAWDYYLIRFYARAGVIATHNYRGWRQGWHVGPALSLGVSLGSGTVGF